MCDAIACPAWVHDNALIARVLNQFLDKIDKQQKRLLIRVNEKNTPELYDFSASHLDYLWSLIEDLETEYKIIKIELDTRYNLPTQYDQAKLYVQPHAEALLRLWLNRPKQIQYAKQWQQACELKLSDNKICPTVVDVLHSLRDKPISYARKKPDEIIERIVQACTFLNQQKTAVSLRTLSARFFLGDSKFVESKATLQTVFQSWDNISPRAILIHLHLPKTINAILFIENQDTFLQLIDAQKNIHHLSTFALVYSAGFKGAGSKIRDKHHVAFSFVHEPCDENVYRAFKHWWYENDGDFTPFFWGDLDYSGMSILSALRQVFTHVTSWQPAYALMQEKINTGHAPDEAHKKEQKDPINTGCEFADTVLLPLMRKHHLFVDQEAILMCEIEAQLKNTNVKC